MGDQKILFLACAYKELVVGSREELDRAEYFGSIVPCLVDFDLDPKALGWGGTDCSVEFSIKIRPSLILGENPHFLISDEGIVGSIVSADGRVVGEARIGCPDLNPSRQEQ